MTLNLHIDLPNDAKLTPQVSQALQKDLQEIAILRLYRQQMLSRHEACQALQVNLREFLSHLKAHGLSEMKDEEDFKNEN